MGRKLCHSQLTGENKAKRVDAEIRLQGQYALHLPSRSCSWALASSRGWLEALRPPRRPPLEVRAVSVEKRLGDEMGGGFLKLLEKTQGNPWRAELKNPLWGHEDACRVSPGPQRLE